MMNKRKSDAYNLGCLAFDLGLDLEDNDYDERDAQHDEWDDGWFSRRDEREQFEAEYDMADEGDK
jgi:hypothetical protein